MITFTNDVIPTDGSGPVDKLGQIVKEEVEAIYQFDSGIPVKVRMYQHRNEVLVSISLWESRDIIMPLKEASPFLTGVYVTIAGLNGLRLVESPKSKEKS